MSVFPLLDLKLHEAGTRDGVHRHVPSPTAGIGRRSTADTWTFNTFLNLFLGTLLHHSVQKYSTQKFAWSSKF